MSSNTTYQKTAKSILGLLDSGIYPAGSRLPGERELSSSLGVSRGRIHEALIALEVQGFVELKGRSGALVVDRGAISLNGLPRSVTPLELTEARALFEAESAALAAPIISDETISQLEDYISVMTGRASCKMTPDEADAAFHSAIARATNNNMIMFVMESMWKIRQENSELRNAYQKICDDDIAMREREHKAILKALKRRNSNEARKAMRAHFTRIIKALLETTEQEAYRAIKKKASERRSRFLLANKIHHADMNAGA